MRQSASMTVTLVVMGVSGVGKSSVAAELVRRTGWAFVEGDDLHPESNRAKMAAGIPLDDDDRWPWLAKVGGALSRADDTGLVIACSALKRAYRDAILAEEPTTRFVDLEGSREMLDARLSDRLGHFMPASLLDSQLATLEPLGQDEPGIRVTIDQSPDEVVDEARARLGVG
jgi:carbohydrate kinase (thermoresistant glucokinase family)